MRIRCEYLALLLPVALTGCAVTPTASSNTLATVSIEGSVHGGSTPLTGARIYMLAANTTGYGQPSVSLLKASDTGTSDSIGAYVTSDSSGNFSIPNGFTCNSTTRSIFTRWAVTQVQVRTRVPGCWPRWELAR